MPRSSALSACLALPFLATAGCTPPAPAGPAGLPPAMTAAVTVAAPVDFPRRARVTGTLLGEEEMTVAAKVSGRVVEVLKDLGDPVAPGETLVRVDPTDYALAMDERARALTQALARLGLEALPASGFDVSQLPALVRARLQAENARARYERGKSLFEKKPPLISEQDFADLETAWKVAESNVRVERLTAESTLAEARTLEAQVRIARQRLEDATHRAPVREGASTGPDAPALRYGVAERRVSLGDFVQVGAPLYRLVDPDPIRMRAQAPERRLGGIRAGQRARVNVEAFSGPFDGRVARVSPAVDVRTRAFVLEIHVANPDGRLKPGSFATADVEIGVERVLAVPESAVVTFAGVHKVFRVKDGKAAEQRVEPGDRADGRVEIRSGLSPGDVVVVSPPASLATGVPVRPVEGGDAPR